MALTHGLNPNKDYRTLGVIFGASAALWGAAIGGTMYATETSIPDVVEFAEKTLNILQAPSPPQQS
ncbi:MAG: hypothetical protein DI586_04990 [Micavibrio aeruginosavorus]|uniref:Uncharacterized protein n=1 Tax=Micavibrio aeruginosavorus TaxID=349221 RepID=A0A2W5FLK9_9BACT|nr:MAG: hypothetical protein DI586_04990 [Micavibrio aeruginosavorus]